MSALLASVIHPLALAAAGGDAAGAFTLAILPDPQEEVLVDDDTRLANRFEWLVAHRADLNLACLLAVGDLMNWDTPEHDQYERASAAVQILDDAALPYAFCLGNRDTWVRRVTPDCPSGRAAAEEAPRDLRNTATYNRYFPVGRFPLVRGTFEPQKIDNAWHTFSAGGLDWLVVNLESWPRRAAIRWARGIVEAHPHHNAILITHSFYGPRAEGMIISGHNEVYGECSGQDMFDDLVSPCATLRLVFSGHTGSHDYRTDTGAAGQTVHGFLQAYHHKETNPVRLLTIDPAAGTIASTVYCPYTAETLDDGSTFTVNGAEWVPTAAR